jgi:hypothetical protein
LEEVHRQTRILLFNIFESFLVRRLLAKILIRLSIGPQPQSFDRGTMWLFQRQQARSRFPDWVTYLW